VASFDEIKGDYPIAIKSTDGRIIKAKNVVTCAGLHADRMAAKSGGTVLPKIVPFRGDYLLLKPDKAHWINGKANIENECTDNSVYKLRKYLPSTRSKLSIFGSSLHSSNEW